MLLSTLPANPFVGLRPFESDESLLFFGRGAQTAELLELLYTNHFVAVVGRSGCGKSSLIRAGLIPKLQAGFLVVDRDRWVVATMKPGDAPLRNLASAVLEAAGEDATPSAVAALADEMSANGVEAITGKLAPVLGGAGANILLLVDQFEEVFRFGSHARAGDDPEAQEDPAVVRGRDESADFVSQMLALSGQTEVPVYVVMTMRSDFLGDCDAFHGLPEAMNRSQYLVPRLSLQQREEAISGPVRLCGQTVTPRLLDLVRNDAGDKLDQLPVMQHAMMRTWDCWRAAGAGPIDVPHYVAAGRIDRALSDDAEKVLAGMSDEERLLTRRVFQSLTDTDSEGRRIRRPAHIRKLEAVTGAGREKIEEIISRFQGGGRSFLAVSPDKVAGNDLVDISHESLIRQWKTLRDWVDEEAESRTTYLDVVDASLRHAEERGALWDDPDLKFALGWWDARRPTPAWAAQYHTPKMRNLKKATKPGQSEKPTPDATSNSDAARGDDEDLALYSGARAFLDESRRACDQELADKERQRRRQLKLTRLITLVIFAAFILTFAAAAYAFRQGSIAERQRLIAEQKTGEALAQKRLAEQQSRRADEQASSAQAERASAVAAGGEAEAQRKLAEDETKKADALRALAEQQRQSALREKQHAVEEAARAQSEARRADAKEVEARQQSYAGDIAFVQHNEEEMGKAALHGRLLLESYYPNEGAGAEQTRPAGDGRVRSGGESVARAAAGARGGKPARDVRGYEWFYLWRLTHRDVHTLTTEQESPVPSVGFSPTGKVAAAHYDGTVDLWDAASAQKVGSAKPAAGQPTAGLLKTAVSPEDGTVAVAYDNGNVALWDGATLKEISNFHACDDAVDVLAFSQDGLSLVTGCAKSVNVWKVAALGMKTPSSIEVPRPKIGVSTRRGYEYGAVALSPDGQTLALVSSKREVKLWNVADGKAEEGLPLPYGPSLIGEPSDYALVEVLAFSPAGRRLAGGTPEGKVMLWVLDPTIPFDFRHAEELPAHDVPVTSLAFSPDGTKLATGGGNSRNGSVKLWDVSPWQQRLLLDSDGDSVGGLSFSPDGRTLAAGYQDGVVRLWDVSSPRGYDELPVSAPASEGLPGASASQSRTYVVNVRFSPDRKMIGALKSDGAVALLDAASGKGLKTFEGQGGANLLSFAFSHDGRVVATGDQTGNVTLYDAASFKQLSPPFSAGNSPVYSVTFSRDDKALAAIVSENDLSSAKVWDVSQGTPGFPKKIALDSNANGATAQYAGWAFSPDGTELAACDEGGDIVIWDIESGREVRRLSTVASPSISMFRAACPPFIVFSDDNSMLAAGDVLWDVAAGKMMQLKGGAGSIGNAAFSPDGRTLATVGDDKVVQLWSTGFSHPPLAVLKGNTGEVYSVAFSADGSVLATGGDDGIKLWRAATEAQVLKQCSTCRQPAGGH